MHINCLSPQVLAGSHWLLAASETRNVYLSNLLSVSHVRLWWWVTTALNFCLAAAHFNLPDVCRQKERRLKPLSYKHIAEAPAVAPRTPYFGLWSTSFLTCHGGQVGRQAHFCASVASSKIPLQFFYPPPNILLQAISSPFRSNWVIFQKNNKKLFSMTTWNTCA